MVTSAQLHDALAEKLVALSGVKVAFADGSTGTPNVLPMTKVVTTMPAVVVFPSDTARTANTGRELYVRQWDADWYVSGVEPDMAMKWINQLHESILASARVDYTLAGRISVVRFLGSRRPAWRTEGDDEARISYLYWNTRWETQQRTGVTYSPT